MATPHKRQFSALLVQDVMDTLFARGVNGELFSAADEKALSHAMRRGGSRTAPVRPMAHTAASALPIQTQRVPAELPLPSVPLEKTNPAKAILTSFIAGALSVGVMVSVGIQSAIGFVIDFAAAMMDAVTYEWRRFQQWVQTGLRKRTLLSKKAKGKKQRLQAHQAALIAQQQLLIIQEEEAAKLRAATETIPTTAREIIPMAATVTTPPDSYALMALPTVHQRPDLQVFINESLPTAVAEVEASPEVFPARPVVTPLVSDAAVRTLMAHHPQPESMAPHSETDRLLHHNRFLASSINNLAERYFSLQHPPQAGV